MNNQVIKSLDLRGVECPLNFVKAKLCLEKMKSGSILELLIDHGEAIETIPNGLSDEGHQVKTIDKISNYYKILVIKCLKI